VCSPTIAALTKQFGLEDLIGKTLASISDARLDLSGNPILAERLLSISGQDPITVPRKNIRGWHCILPTRLMLATNELPEIGDASGALPSRFLALKFTRSFEHNENTSLTDELMEEISGIMTWALEGGSRLQHRGPFIQPASASQVVEILHALSSPVSEFVKDRCVPKPNFIEQKEAIYTDWVAWCKPQGIPPGTGPAFGKKLFAALPYLEEGGRPRFDGVRKTCYKGLKLVVDPEHSPAKTAVKIVPKKVRKGVDK